METKLMEIDEKSIIVQQDAIITFKNFTEIKDNLKAYVDQFKDFELLTEDDFKRNKKDIAKFNNDIKLFNRMRIDVKNKVLKPYDNLVLEVKELENIINPTLLKYKSKSDAYSLQLTENKKADIEKEFEEFKTLNPTVDFIQLDNIFNTAWLNKGFKIQDISNELSMLFEKASNDLDLINLEGELGARIKTKYLTNGFNFVDAKTKVLGEVARETTDQEQIKASMEEKGLIINKDLNTPIQSVKSSVIKEPKVSIKEVQTMDFRVTGDKAILQEIVQFMRTKDVQLEQLKGEN